MLKQCRNILFGVIAVGIITFALLLNVARIATPYFDNHQEQFARFASKILQHPVTISHVRVTWYDFHPAFSLNDVKVYTKDHRQQVLRFQHFIFTVDLLSSLRHLRWLPGQVAIDGMNITVHQSVNNHFRLSGIDVTHQQASAANADYIDGMLVWLLTQTQVRLQHINILWLGPNHFVLPIHNLTLSITNLAEGHQLSGRFSLQQTTATSCQFAVRFNSVSPLDARFAANAYVHLQDVVLPQWLKQQQLAHSLTGLAVADGIGQASVWLHWQHGHLVRLHTLFNINHAAVTSAKLAQQFYVNNLAANVLYQRHQHGMLLSADHVQITLNHEVWPENQIAISTTDNAEHQLVKLAANLDVIKWRQVLHILAHAKAMPKQWQQFLTDNKININLHHLTFVYQPQLSGWQKLSLTTDFNSLNLRNEKYHIHVVGGAGDVALLDNKLTLTLQPHATELSLPNWFMWPLKMQTLSGQLVFARRANGWQAELHNLYLSDGNFQANVKASLLNSATTDPVIHLVSHFSLADAKAVRQYIPKQHLSVHLQQWLRQAFVNGSAADGVFTWNGAVNQFPYQEGGGDFLIKAKIHNATLNYLNGWPMLHDINADLKFHNQQMLIKAKQAYVDHVKVSAITASIKDLHSSGLDLQGQFDGDLAKAEQYLTQTPLAVGKQFHAVSMRGKVNGKLAIHLPLHNHSEKTVNGLVNIQDAGLSVPKWAIAVNRLNGTVHFTQATITGKQIKGYFLQQPITINIASKDITTKPYVDVNLQGKLAVTPVLAHFKLPKLNWLNGAAHFSADLALFPLARHETNQFTLHSSLKGIAVNLPKPLGKLASAVTPLSLSLTTSLTQPVQVRAAYSGIASLYAELNNNSWQINHGLLSLGKSITAASAKHGLTIAINLPTIAITPWRNFLQQRNQSAAIVPSLIYVYLQHVNFLKQEWHDLRMSITPMATHYAVTITSNLAKGVLDIPKTKQGTLKARMDYVSIPSGGDNKRMSWLPTELPNLDVMVQQLNYQQGHLGTLTLKANRVAKGLQIPVMKLQAKSATLTASASWLVTGPKQQQSKIAATLFGRNIGATLSDWHMAKLLSGGAGSIKLNLSYPAALTDFALASASGHVIIHLDNGRIVQLSQSTQNELGLGRLLNLLSLESLPKRLMLDFNDLSEKGFAFDKMRGEFTLSNGLATTPKSSIVGSVADVLMHGVIDVRDKTYRLHVSVKPHVTESLPMIATLTGGPVAGVITWLVNTVFVNPAVSEAAMVKYYVTGPWQKPQMTKLKN